MHGELCQQRQNHQVVRVHGHSLPFTDVPNGGFHFQFMVELKEGGALLHGSPDVFSTNRKVDCRSRSLGSGGVDGAGFLAVAAEFCSVLGLYTSCVW